MTTREALVVDAFADEPFAGNPAGVVPDATGLEADQMGAIAAELNAGVTAFVVHADDADRGLQFFTPDTDVDRSGHATVATHACLFERAMLAADAYTVETEAGILEVRLDSDGTVWMTRAEPRLEELGVEYGDVAAVLGLDPATLRDVGADLPLSRASVGSPWLMVPVNYFEHLRSVTPDAAAIGTLCDRTDTEGVYAFTFDTLDGDATLHARAFAPTGGAAEAPITGTAAGACGAFVRRHGAVEPDMGEIVVEQGHFLDRPGRARVRVDGQEVQVGGRATVAIEGEIAVPDATGSHIIQA